ncbi:MAG: SHOCT domain-containing protein [Desulfuromonadales bacterium]|nr:SHOCT domain-containing protein [Desulfuromonadales bacterium]
MHGYGMMNGWGTMGPLMWVLMLLFWGFAIFGVICAARWLLARKPPEAGQGKESPMDILKVRYARGEISREEFERMKEELK